MTPAEFHQAMHLSPAAAERVIVRGGALGGDTIFVHFYNLTAARRGEKRGGGAEAENNRQMFSINGATGKVKHMVNALSVKPLAGRTRKSVADAAHYVGTYINAIVETVPPKLTHE